MNGSEVGGRKPKQHRLLWSGFNTESKFALHLGLTEALCHYVVVEVIGQLSGIALVALAVSKKPSGSSSSSYCGPAVR